MYVIAVVGAGGKTTRIKHLTEKYVQQGKRVLITTTTHMYQEPGMVLNGNLEDIRHQLDNQHYCICGMSAQEAKFGPLPDNIYEQACQLADIVLVEADGSRHLPIKFPADNEPVIPGNVNEIQVVMGLQAIGQPFSKVSHRLELVKKCLDVSDTDLVSRSQIEKLWQEGYEKPLHKKYPGVKIVFCPENFERSDTVIPKSAFS